eukprot:117287-Prorocentrum_lima.AAC.1
MTSEVHNAQEDAMRSVQYNRQENMTPKALMPTKLHCLAAHCEKCENMGTHAFCAPAPNSAY